MPSIVTAETNAINKLTRMQHRLQLLTQNFGEIKRYRICIKEYQSQRTLIIIFYLLNVFDPKATVLMSYSYHMDITAGVAMYCKASTPCHTSD